MGHGKHDAARRLSSHPRSSVSNLSLTVSLVTYTPVLRLRTASPPIVITMGLDARGVTSVIELIFYLPVLLISILLVARHGFKREGWIYLLLLANSDYSVRISTIQAADSVWRSPSDWGNHSYHR